MKNAAAWMLAPASLLLLLTRAAHAIDINVSGPAWNPVYQQSAIASPGQDFNPTAESDPGAITLDVSNSGGASWEVTVQLTPGSWNSNLTLYVRLTSAGTGGTVAGGTDYVQIPTSQAVFFTGSGDVSGIAIQYQLSGVSVANANVGDYSTPVTFTVLQTGS